MTVAEAVSLHQKHFTPELASQYKISGPAYSQGKLDDLKVSPEDTLRVLRIPTVSTGVGNAMCRKMSFRLRQSALLRNQC
jgi:hypothetical protein